MNKSKFFNSYITLIICLISVSLHAKDYKVSSPDGRIKLLVSITEDINYSFTVDDQSMLKPSQMTMTVNENIVLGKNPKVSKSTSRSIDRILEPEVWVKSKMIVDKFNELTLSFKGKYALVFRVFDNGVAYRFETKFKGDLIVVSEKAVFNFSGNNHIYFPREEEFHSHNERLYEYHQLDSLTNKDLCSLPALVTTDGKTTLFISETALLDYPGMWLRGEDGNTLVADFPHLALEEEVDKNRWTDDRTIRVTKTADHIAVTNASRSFPWRIIGISKSDDELITNQLTYQLAEPCRIEDYSWIKPGKVAWDWWNYNNVYGVDFKAGVNTETYKYFIDFAADYGLDYIILDEGWYVLGDILKVVPEVDIPTLVAYGKKKNVELILWTTWSSLDHQLEKALDTFQAWGIKGIKVDFMQRDDQWMVNYYQRIAKACANRKLLVDFHGAYKPAGLRRTYPNVISREGVKGAENNKWDALVTPEHNVTLPFIRMVAGPMDYTPGAMVNAQEENYRAIWNRPMSMGTRCHQLAMYVVYESPLQMLCDNPSNYYKEKECTKFISMFPTVWEETKVLNASIGNYIAVARKNDDSWYLGAMTDGDARELNIDFSFLDEGDYNIEIFQDGINANRYASDYKKIVREISAGDNLKISMAPGGGWAARIYK